MRSQVVALIFVALIASSHCQAITQVQECLNNAWSLGETISAFIDKQNWSDMQAINAIVTKVQQVFIPCSSLIKSLKAAPAPLGLNLNFNCIGQISAAIVKIQALKGRFNGGLNFELVLAELISRGIDASALRNACK